MIMVRLPRQLSAAGGGSTGVSSLTDVDVTHTSYSCHHLRFF